MPEHCQYGEKKKTQIWSGGIGGDRAVISRDGWDRREVMAKKWIQKAIKHEGAFTKKADAAGKSVSAYATQVTKKGSTASTTTKRQANLAKTLKKMSKKKGKG